MQILVGALIIGMTVGLLGAGGSLLTVPVLVYVLGHETKAAIAESLAIVGGIALVAMAPYARAGLVDWRNTVFFGLPGTVGTYYGAWLAKFLSGSFQLLLFGAMLLCAAWIMLRDPTARTVESDGSEADELGERAYRAPWFIALEGLSVGVLTGLVGVGGGFLIVPALILLGGLPVRTAIGTSLTIIAMKSFAGFYKYLDVLESLDMTLDWGTVGAFMSVGAIGGLLGTFIGSRLNQRRLRQAFAAFLVAISLLMIAKEAPKLWPSAGARACGNPVNAPEGA